MIHSPLKTTIFHCHSALVDNTKCCKDLREMRAAFYSLADTFCPSSYLHCRQSVASMFVETKTALYSDVSVCLFLFLNFLDIVV